MSKVVNSKDISKFIFSLHFEFLFKTFSTASTLFVVSIPYFFISSSGFTLSPNESFTATISMGDGQSSFHIDILVFGLLYSPLSEIIGIISNIISRKHEFEADAYAKNIQWECVAGSAQKTLLS